MATVQCDIAIIGGGSAGYAAARTAHEAGANVAVIDQGPWGGLCILRGCMPSKAILRSAEIASHLGPRRRVRPSTGGSSRRFNRHRRAQGAAGR